MKGNKINKDCLVLPVYLNEKIVIDMLAIIEDGFSMVSEVNTTLQQMDSNNASAKAGLSTSNILSKFLKIELAASLDEKQENGTSQLSKQEKVHTNVSLFSKFKAKLEENDLLISGVEGLRDINKINSGDFIEIAGVLQKNPMVNILEKAIDVFRMAEIFQETPQLGNKKQAANNKAEDNKVVKQMKLFLDELKVTGTVDFVVKSDFSTIVLSVQEKYLENDNISELIGGNFKVLGKVIKVCKDENESINLLRKTTLDILNEDNLKEFTDVFKSTEFMEFNLPQLQVKIPAPSAIIIPIAIYA
ncbi:MAG: hypothetical protein ACK5MK_05905 [Dysgonomonas sp.]